MSEFPLYHNEFERAYKGFQSSYRTWKELAFADKWQVFWYNIGPNQNVDETSLSDGTPRRAAFFIAYPINASA